MTPAVPARPRRPATLVLALVVGMLGTIVPGTGAPVAAQESLLAQVFPEAATLGVPPAIEVGSELTWYLASATVAQSRFQWVEDPDGTWEDPSTGKRYRRTDESGEGTGSGAGDGYAVMDVVALEGSSVVTNTLLLVIDRLGGVFTLAPLGGGRVPGAVVDGAWMHPALLERIAAEGYSGFQVLTGPYTLDGRAFEAVSLVSRGAGGYQSWTWDRATGLLMVASSRLDGAYSPFTAPGEASPQASSSLSYRQFTSARRRTTPGIGTPVPEWVGRTDGLRWSGSYTFVNPMDPSSQAMVFGYTSEATFSDGGPTWANVRFRNVIDFNGAPSAADATGIGTGTGSWWWDPASLATMKPGDVLDENPVTQLRVTVEDTMPWQGGDSVVIRTELPGNRIRSQFDVATGVLLSSEIIQQGAGTTIAFGLERLP